MYALCILCESYTLTMLQYLKAYPDLLFNLYSLNYCKVKLFWSHYYWRHLCSQNAQHQAKFYTGLVNCLIPIIEVDLLSSPSRVFKAFLSKVTNAGHTLLGFWITWPTSEQCVELLAPRLKKVNFQINVYLLKELVWKCSVERKASLRLFGVNSFYSERSNSDIDPVEYMVASTVEKSRYSFLVPCEYPKV